MKDDSKRAQAAVQLRGYTMHTDLIEAWESRHDQGQCSVASAPDPNMREEDLKMSCETVMVAAIAEALARGSKEVTMADVDAACLKLGHPWPYCNPN